MSVTLYGAPLPPSSNNQYASFVRGGRLVHVPSKDLVAYKRTFAGWARLNRPGIQCAIELLGDGGVEVEAFFAFERTRLYTKKDAFKKLDVSNRLKALHDGLSEALGIDDCRFFSVTAEKYFVEDATQEQVIVRLSPFAPRGWPELRNILVP